MKSRTFIIFLFCICLYISFSINTFAGYWDIEGWDWIDNKEKVVLWQKKDKQFISEALVKASVPIGSAILKGYTVKFNTEQNISDYQYDNFPIGIWMISYNGFDTSGNIYLKLIREKNTISNLDIDKLQEEIQKISSYLSEKNTIEKRLELYDSIFNNYLDKEGEVIIVDPSKTIVIYSINDIPPFAIETNENHTVIEVSVKSLD